MFQITLKLMKLKVRDNLPSTPTTQNKGHQPKGSLGPQGITGEQQLSAWVSAGQNVGLVFRELLLFKEKLEIQICMWNFQNFMSIHSILKSNNF